MKVANIINVILQGLGLLITFGSMIFCYIDSNQGEYKGYRLLENEAIIAGIAFICIGGYQFLHAFVMSILKLVRKEFNWLLGIYWILGVLYIIGLLVILGISNFHSFSDNMLFTCVFATWIPVIYYFIISIIDMVRTLKK